MFRDSSTGIEEYTTSVTGFINKCIDDVVPTVTVKTVEVGSLGTLRLESLKLVLKPLHKFLVKKF